MNQPTLDRMLNGVNALNLNCIVSILSTLQNRIGRKKTVLISLAVTAVSLVIPAFGEGYTTMLLSFSLLGISNAIMQTSLNPLVSNLISGDKLASTLTFGQFVKAIASFLAPILAAWGATTLFPTFGLGWRVLFIIYAVVSLLSVSLLAATPIDEERPDRASGVVECLRLLGRPFILLCFLGAFILRMMSPRLFFDASVVMMLAGMGILFVCDTLTPLYAGIALIGFGNSNIFSVIFAQALIASPDEKNEVSGLMIMGLFGGTVFPLAMGFAADTYGQVGAVAVMTAGVAYLIFYTLKIKKS
jgi:fucose permease